MVVLVWETREKGLLKETVKSWNFDPRMTQQNRQIIGINYSTEFLEDKTGCHRFYVIEVLQSRL